MSGICHCVSGLGVGMRHIGIKTPVKTISALCFLNPDLVDGYRI